MILCKHISFATPLCSLSVVGNRVPDGAVVPLAGLMLPCAACKLEFLDISQNFSLGTTAAIKLAQALENNTDLQDLRLANCQLGVSQGLIPSDMFQKTVAALGKYEGWGCRFCDCDLLQTYSLLGACRCCSCGSHCKVFVLKHEFVTAGYIWM